MKGWFQQYEEKATVKQPRMRPVHPSKAELRKDKTVKMYGKKRIPKNLSKSSQQQQILILQESHIIFGEIIPLFWTKVQFLAGIPLQNHSSSFWLRGSIPKQWTIFWPCYRNSNNIRTLQCSSEAQCSPGINYHIAQHLILFFQVCNSLGWDIKGPLRLWGRNQGGLLFWSSHYGLGRGESFPKVLLTYGANLVRDTQSPAFCYKIS